MDPGGNIHRHCMGGMPGLQHFHTLPVFPLNGAAQSNAEYRIDQNNAVLSRRFLPRPHLHSQVPGNGGLGQKFRSPTVRIPHHKQAGFISLQVQHPGSRHTVRPIVARAAHGPDHIRFPGSLLNRPGHPHGRPFHQHHGGHSNGVDRIGVNRLHLFCRYQSSHPRLPPRYEHLETVLGSPGNQKPASKKVLSFACRLFLTLTFSLRFPPDRSYCKPCMTNASDFRTGVHSPPPHRPEPPDQYGQSSR